MAGELPEQQLHTYPAEEEDEDYHEMTGGDSWDLNAVIFEGAIGPFLSVEIGVWDKDDTTEDDMHGMILGLWLAPDLIETFRKNYWRPLRFTSVERGGPLTVDFQIEPLEPETIGLYNWWSEARGDHFSTSQFDWAESRASARREPGYVALGLQGRVFNPALPQPEGTVPLYSWWSPSREDNFTTSDPRWAGGPGTAKAPDYGFHRVEGYIYDPTRPQPPGTIPLYSWWNHTRGDNFTTSDPRWAGTRWTKKAGYGFNRLEGYIIGEILF
jgi:hypothetical protein